jgi:Carbohydrate-selective porin, OprB family/S-layer homology domain
MLSKVLWNSLLVTPALLGAALIANSSAIAAESQVSVDTAESLATVSEVTVSSDDFSTTQVDAIAPAEVALTPAETTAPAAVEVAPVVEAAPAQTQSAETVPSVSSLDEIMQYGSEGGTESMSQVTSISQLSDVYPTDWAFQALQSLVERYGCIAGYPDGTYRGRNFMTRYEFAAGLNACMDRVSELIAAGLADAVTREDLATLQRLQEEFAAELATLRGRVDALEARVSELEANQFSTTTKLRGETIMALGVPFSGLPDDDDESIFSSRVRLNFDTSFTGEDRLRARLESGNFTGWTRGTFGGQTAYSFGTGTDNAGSGRGDFRLSRLEYRFPLGPATVFIEAQGGGISDIVTTVSPFDDPGQGSISYFGYNPIYDVGFQNIGAGATIDFTDSIQLGFGYLSDTGNLTGNDQGIFGGNYTAFGQLTLTPGPLTVALTYANSYGNPSSPTRINAYGLSANFDVSSKFFVGGWFSYIDSDVFEEFPSESEIWTYAGYVGINDLGSEGSQLGLIVGVPPYSGSTEFPGFGFFGSQDNTLHIEAFYRYALNDNISITPGVLWLIDPGNTDTNEDAFIGTIRTTFTF